MATGYTYSNGTNGVYATGTYTIDPGTFYTSTTATLHTTEGSKQLNTQVKTVQVKAGHLGQVVVPVPGSYDLEILWESKPKKTPAKAQKAAQKAQLEAARGAFDWIEA